MAKRRRSAAQLTRDTEAIAAQLVQLIVEEKRLQVTLERVRDVKALAVAALGRKATAASEAAFPAKRRRR